MFYKGARKCRWLEQAAEAELKYQAHNLDPVATWKIMGGNQGTGGNASEGKSTWQEWLGLGGAATVHSCYGKGNYLCMQKNYWNQFSNEIPEWKSASYNLKKD